MESAAATIRDPADHLPRRRPGFRRRQRPRRFPERLAARHRRYSGLAPASRARRMRNADRRRGPRQLRRHRHDDAAALRPCRRRRGRALLAAVRRPRAGARGGELAASAAARRAPARRALPAARRSRSASTRRWRSASSATASRRASSTRQCSDRRTRLLAKPAGRAAPDAAPAAHTAQREEILERMQLEGDAVCRTADLGRGQGSDQRLFREAKKPRSPRLRRRASSRSRPASNGVSVDRRPGKQQQVGRLRVADGQVVIASRCRRHCRLSGRRR